MSRLLNTLAYHLLVPLAIFFCVALPCKTSTGQQLETDPAKLFAGIERRPTESAFIAAPREVIRPLLRCKKLMAAGKVGDAVEILGEVLADDTVEDYLISRGSRSFGSLRSRTESILGSIDSRFLEPYQVRYGIRARKLLERGIAENDLGLLEKVSNQYFFTDSGAEAAMLLGHMELSNGQPSAAQSWFAKIVRFPATAAKHDPEASILLATCQLLGNNRIAAKRTLVSLKYRLPDSSIEVMGKNYTLFSRNDDAVVWLTKLIGDSPLASSQVLNKWLMFQGNPSRTGKTGTGMPLLAARWEHRTAETTSLQKSSSKYIDTLIQGNAPPSPASQPLVVGDTIVFRGVERMFGVDAESGLRKWSWPPQLAWNEKPNVVSTHADEVRMQQRLVMDSIYGRASSDGKLIFFVPDPGSSNSHQHNNVFNDANTSHPEDLRTCNELVAIDARSSGMLRWRVGGPNGLDEPRLARAFFMGEPLPLEGVLYCCCVLDNAVQLVALDANTGKLRWAQAIAAYDQVGFDTNHSRRLAGVTPSYADGKLVCLTGTGAVVAIELSTRSMLWGYEYRLPHKTQIVSDSKSEHNVLTDVWRDSQVTISNGKVFLTPVLERQLICLDLDTGYGVWFEEDGFMEVRVNRKDSLYFAGINRDQLILVGARNVRAIDSFTGTEAWTVELGIDDLPSGRGYIGEDSLYVPTASRKVLRIDLVDGEIAESVGTSRVLGNLSRVKGDVVSHGVDHVASFPEFDTSKKKIEDLPRAELNEDQNFILLQTMIQQGDLEQGVDLLIDLAEENSRPRYSVLLNSCANNFRIDHPALSLKALDSLKRLYPKFDVEELERLRMLSKLRTGEFRESVQLGMDQLEEKFAKYCESDPRDSTDDASNRIFKGISAVLLDRPDEMPVEPPRIKGIEQVDFDNRYDKILYSEFGWQRTKLQMAIEGLQQQDPDAAAELNSRISKLVAASCGREGDAHAESALPKNGPSSGRVSSPGASPSQQVLHKKQLQWLLERLPVNAFDVPTLEFVAKHFLESDEHLAALIYVNVAIDRGGEDVERLKLLKSEILFAGRDVRAAVAAVAKVDAEDLDDEAASRLVELKQQIADASESASSNVRSSTNWFSNDSANATAGVEISSTKQKQKPPRYRIPFEFGIPVDPIYHSLQLHVCPWGDKDKEFELRNSRGNLVRSMRLRSKGDTTSYGYTRRCYVDVQNHVAEFRISKATLYVDWFKVLAGENGNLWKLPITQMGALRTAFSGGRETVVGSGNTLYCYDTLTGKLVWKRKMQHAVKRVVAHGSRLTSWSEIGRQFNTVEFATGRLVRTATSRRYIVSKTFEDHFVLEHPIRKGELPADQEKTLTGPEGPKNAAQIAKRFAVYDASTGQIVWETIFHPKSSLNYWKLEVAEFEQDGTIRFMDLKSGNVNAEITLPLTEAEKQATEGISLRKHSAGWVVQVRIKDHDDRFMRGKATYRYEYLHSKLGSGPVYLLDDAREKLVWQSPAYLERMEYLESQPFDSPVIMFGRHIVRTVPEKGELHYMQTVCLDSSTGNVMGNQVMKTLESYDGYAMDWEQSKPGSPFDTLVISTAVEVQRVKFGSDVELPPLPSTHLTFNAIDFFDDPIFTEAKAEVIDSRVEEFRQRAVAAEKVRKAQQASSAAEMKKRMNVGSMQKPN